MGLFDGKVALVTGAGRGIGRSESLLLASEGAKVVVNDLGGSGSGEGADSTPAQEVVDEIKAAGGDAVANYDDCSSWAGGESMVQQAIDTFGGIDVLICNAGILRDKMSFNMSEEEFDAVIRVHLKGHFAPIRFASSYWRTKAKETGEPANAAIVTTASESGLYGNAGQTNYAAAKAGIASMTIVLARELERSGVRVNSIAPVAATRLLGTVATRAHRQPDDGPDNPAAGAVWLASPLAEGITGQVLKISGGVAQIVDGWRPVTQISSTDKWTIQDLADGRDRLFKDRDPGVPSFRAFDKFEDTIRRRAPSARRSGRRRPRGVVDVVGDDGLDQLVDVEELEPGEERVALVDVGVADVHVAVGGELRLHLVEVVLAADELGLDAVA